MMKTAVFTELDWYLANFKDLFEKYKGEWIAIVKEDVIAHSKDPEEIHQKIIQRTSEFKNKPFVVKVIE